MPEGGFIEHAQKECIIVAHNNTELLGYLMFRIVVSSSKLSVVHLCVKEKFRRQNIPTKLLDSLRKKYQSSFSGISLSCREDYSDASALWERYGFSPSLRKRSRSNEEKYLRIWWYDFNHPDLFSCIQDTTLKVTAILDTNIIIKLRDSNEMQDASQDPRLLLADWLIEEVEYFYAPELFSEITRDRNKDREERTRRFLGNFIKINADIEECKKITEELKAIITGNTVNDISDRKQLATAIVANTPYFVTFDSGILSKKEAVEEKYSLQIFDPLEFVIEIDRLLNKEEYSPIKLKGVAFHTVEKASNDELDDYIDLFTAKSNSEKKKEFKSLVYSCSLQSRSSTTKVIKKEENAIAFFSYKIENSELLVSFIRLFDEDRNQTLFMQLISDFINEAIKEKLSSIKIVEIYLSDSYKSILARFGFYYDGQFLMKMLYNKIIKSHDFNKLCHNTFSNLLSDKDVDMIMELIKIELKYFPLKFLDDNIPCYIIPIRPYWAGELFDQHISGSTLFGAQPNKIWNIENVYYRDKKPITEKAPARILWYASKDKDVQGFRNNSIIASSYLNEVMTDKPKLLYQRNKHYGIYEWKNIYKLCKKDITNDIRALRFSNTEVFNNPVDFSTVKDIFIANGRRKNTFASPVKIENNIFIQIYKIGRGINE